MNQYRGRPLAEIPRNELPGRYVWGSLSRRYMFVHAMVQVITYVIYQQRAFSLKYVQLKTLIKPYWSLRYGINVSLSFNSLTYHVIIIYIIPNIFVIMIQPMCAFNVGSTISCIHDKRTLEAGCIVVLFLYVKTSAKSTVSFCICKAQHASWVMSVVIHGIIM